MSDDITIESFPNRNSLISKVKHRELVQIGMTPEFDRVAGIISTLDNEVLLRQAMWVAILEKMIEDLIKVTPNADLNPIQARDNIERLPEEAILRLHADLMAAAAQSERLTRGFSMKMGDGLIDDEIDYEVTIVDHDQHFNMT